MFEGLFARVRNGDRSAEATPAPVQPAATRPSIGLALGGGAARGFRPYRRDAYAGRARHRAGRHRRHLDRRRGRRLLRRQPTRRLRGVGAGPHRARHPELSRHQPVRLRPHPRQPSRQTAGNRARRPAHRRSADPLCRDRHRIQYRPRNLAHPRAPGRGVARLLCVAGNFSAGADRRPLAGRRRAGQSGTGVGGARARRPARDRGQSQFRSVRARHHHCRPWLRRRR